MHWVKAFRSRSAAGIAGLILLAAGATATATFEAPGPNQDLRPIGGAAQVIDLLQSNGAILWTSMAGPVTRIEVQGWPVHDGDVDLGGALVIERPEEPYAGALNFGEPPMTATFEVGP